MHSGVSDSVVYSSSALSAPSSSIRFHAHHGDNIVLLQGRTVAFRRASFADGIVFSSRPLWPNELFLLEIDRNENGWSGHLRLGLTSIDPDSHPALPHYALPDMNASGRAWIYAITRHHQRVYDGMNGVVDLPLTREPLFIYLVNGNAANGDVREEQLDGAAAENAGPSNRAMDGDENGTGQLNDNGHGVNMRLLSSAGDGVRLPTDVGSHVGVYYRLAPDGTAEMHYVINGVDQGPSAVSIPYNGRDGPRLYALVDVYGSTKQVRVVQLAPCVAPLQHLCRIRILKSIDSDFDLDSLPLPEKLKAFLRFKQAQTSVNPAAVQEDEF